uniref:DUF761 domain-containing protein n=2 Tax=Cajanus cajan TaxID=3821 RepID=A0A151SRN5_CAJCA|nr:hypothetical protein KK1_003716 [Cajanus cajan]KYP71492.1 hypothetical protein KK1_010752 [Cajanus cajan]
MKERKSVLERLRMAVQKVKLLLGATVLSHAWHAASLLRRGSQIKRQVSLDDRAGLMICASEETDSEGLVHVSSPSSARSLQRTISYPSSDDDIDKRAEMFIANFRRQLHMERQISLQLRYCRENTLQLPSP